MKKSLLTVRFIDMSSTESRVSPKKAGIPMRTETEMFDVILQTAKALQVDACRYVGSRTNQRLPRTSSRTMMWSILWRIWMLWWLTLLGWTGLAERMIEQHVLLDHRRLYLMLFEDGNRIDLTLCPRSTSKSGWIAKRISQCWMTRRGCLLLIHRHQALLDGTSQCD